MKSLRFLDRRAGYSLGSIGLLLGMVAPAVLPAFASAAQVSSRSIQLSSSAAGATSVNYEVKFTTATGTPGAFVLDFCNNSPIPGQACTAPTGFDSSAATVAGGSTTPATVAPLASSDSQLVVTVTTPVAAPSTYDVTLTGITNPTAATTHTTGFYARIVTYDTASHANSEYTSASGLGADAKDNGGIAMAITDAIGVTAAVRESMTFCVSGADGEPTADCGGTTTPSVTLGEGTPPATALDPSVVSVGNVYTQLSTNASHGAVVNLKSSATGCGGLVRIGAPGSCDIVPSTGADGPHTLAIGVAAFGVKTGTSTDASGAGSPSGTLEPAASSSYNSSTYFMNYISGDASGITSTYGDPFLDSSGAPINNQNMELTFGASANNTTPAGIYSATLNMIATGTF